MWTPWRVVRVSVDVPSQRSTQCGHSGRTSSAAGSIGLFGDSHERQGAVGKGGPGGAGPPGREPHRRCKRATRWRRRGETPPGTRQSGPTGKETAVEEQELAEGGHMGMVRAEE
jgi:hypothetical protein